MIFLVVIHDKKNTIHDKNITNRDIFCSLGTALTGWVCMGRTNEVEGKDDGGTRTYSGKASRGYEKEARRHTYGSLVSANRDHLIDCMALQHNCNMTATTARRQNCTALHCSALHSKTARNATANHSKPHIHTPPHLTLSHTTRANTPHRFANSLHRRGALQQGVLIHQVIILPILPHASRPKHATATLLPLVIVVV